MVKQYSEKFKRNAVALLRKVKWEKIEIGEKTISNVRELCEHLDVSSYSIYKWDKEIDAPEIDQEIIDSIEEEEEVNEIEILERPRGLLTINSEIRFYSLLASIFRIKGYSSMPLAQLKLKLGLYLIRDSKLIHTIIKNGEVKGDS